MGSRIVSLRSRQVKTNRKLIYSEIIFHVDFKSEEFAIEYLRTTSEKVSMEKTNPCMTLLVRQKGVRLILSRFWVQYGWKMLFTWYLYKVCCKLTSNQKRSPANI